MTDEKKCDVVLSDGRQITFDKRKIKRQEWKALFSIDQTDEEAEDVLGRFSGTSAEYIHNLSLYDWQMLLRVAADVVRQPVDPNSPSGSI